MSASATRRRSARAPRTRAVARRSTPSSRRRCARRRSGRGAAPRAPRPRVEAREAGRSTPSRSRRRGRGGSRRGSREELADTEDRLLRLQADFENFRKRALRERQEAAQYGSQNLFKDLLSVVDNLERAIEHARESGGGDLASILQGVELVRRELLGVLEKHDVTEIEALGKPFDPALHEAMAQVESGTVPPNTVIEVLQKGFQLRDRLLRPARVIVAKAAERIGASGGGDRRLMPARAPAGGREHGQGHRDRSRDHELLRRAVRERRSRRSSPTPRARARRPRWSAFSTSGEKLVGQIAKRQAVTNPDQHDLRGQAPDRPQATRATR